MVETINPSGSIHEWSGRIKLEVFDKPGGKLIHTVDEELHSFVRNFYNLQVCALMAYNVPFGTAGDNDLSIVATNGNEISQATKVPVIGNGMNTNGAAYRAQAANDTFGILIGDSATAFDFDQFGLLSQIPDGTGLDEMSHIASEATVLTWSGGTRKFTSDIVRFFNNNSGAGITVREVVLVSEMGFWLTGGSDAVAFVTMARDVLGAPPAVGDGGQLKVTYSLVSPAFPA